VSAADCQSGVCTAGKCACPLGQTDCGGACVDLKTDAGHCGECATACGVNGTCLQGLCLGPHCEGVAPLCGPAANEDCCQSPSVPGGTFYRTYDGIDFTDKSFAATVSGFRLDRYEVTVGRFRAFVAATEHGWQPKPGAGKHVHVNNGGGITGESGWEAAWPLLPSDASTWDTKLACLANLSTWTPSSGGLEPLPLNCASWYEAYAFCIWDGGFLPTEAEWNLAASGGDEQRYYPWSGPFPSGTTTTDESYASYYIDATKQCHGDKVNGCSINDIRVPGSYSPKGDGKWGHADLAGNMFELTLDWFSSAYAPLCVNCANTQMATNRSMRGGSFNFPMAQMRSANRNSNTPTTRSSFVGFRCARPPT
jgi:formylglycine-generating enzyme